MGSADFKFEEFAMPGSDEIKGRNKVVGQGGARKRAFLVGPSRTTSGMHFQIAAQ